MPVAYYNSSREVEHGLKIVAEWLSKNRNIKVVYHNGTTCDADPEKGIIRIPRTGHLEFEDLMKLRTFVYHEGGHIAETNIKKPKGALGQITNAVEDVRMQTKQAKEHEGCGLVYDW